MQIGVSASLLSFKDLKGRRFQQSGAQYEKAQPPANKMGTDKRATRGIVEAWSIDVEKVEITNSMMQVCVIKYFSS